MRTFTFLVIENATDVCEGIIRRMQGFEKWTSLGFATGVNESIEKIKETKPDLLFIDWSLNGGSAFEVLQHIQNADHYNPYIIFNTGYQKDNPEIPQQLINRFHVDKYIIKPYWEHLRQFLPAYLLEAEEKALHQTAKPKSVWLENEKGEKVLIDLTQLICICQHPQLPRSRIFYLNTMPKEIIVPLQWQKCMELLDQFHLDYFVSKNRSHIIFRSFIIKFEKPFVRLKNFPAKVEIVKENIRDFEKWMYT